MKLNKIMKRSALVMAMLMAGSALAGCGASTSSTTAVPAAATGTEASSDNGEAGKPEDGKIYKVGVIQLLEHDALDAANKGFVDALAEEGFVVGENLELDQNNAQNEQANCQTIASKLVNDNNDLILAIATPAAQAVANATKDIPILVTCVTDPASSKLVATNEAPGGNVSGTSDLTPVKEQMELLKQILPEAKTVGMLYTSSESNSKFQIDLAKAAAKELGLKTIEATISNSNEIQQVAQSLVGKVDAIYAPTDNTIAQAMATVSTVTFPAKIPVICGESGMVDNGGLATIGINYYNLGKQTGIQAAKILRGEADPATMPIEYLKEMDVAVNEEVASKLGITIPQEILDRVTK